MVKRKANVSVDEWLGEGINPSRPSPATTTPVAKQPALTNLPVPASITVPAGAPVTTSTKANGVPAGSLPVELVTATGGDGPVNQEEAAEWFWNMLAQAGYERW